MRPAFAIVFALTLLVAVAPAAPVPTHLMKQSVLYYPTTVGTKWVYSDPDGEETLMITKVESTDRGKVVTVEKVGDGRFFPEEKMAVSSEGLARVEARGYKFDPPSVMLKAPFRPGDKWKSEPTRDEENATIFGVEKVKVPAGVFEAVRVDAKYATEKQTDPASFWYAPGVGLVKFACDGKEQVLKSFTPGTGHRP